MFKCSRKDMHYINNKLNATEDYDDMRIKVLDEDEFCLSKNYNKKCEKTPYIVHYSENDKKVVHPKIKIRSLRENNHYFVPE